jgi:hypothetical protein
MKHGLTKQGEGLYAKCRKTSSPTYHDDCWDDNDNEPSMVRKDRKVKVENGSKPATANSTITVSSTMEGKEELVVREDRLISATTAESTHDVCDRQRQRI